MRFHVNDYPADLPRATINDCTGSSAAWVAVVGNPATIHAAGFRGALSLELFNPGYYRRDPSEVAREGLEDRAAVAKAGFATG